MSGSRVWWCWRSDYVDLQLGACICSQWDFFDVLCGLIIHNVQLWLKPFCCQFFKVRFVHREDAHVVQHGDGLCKDGIWFIVVEYKKTNTAIKGHEGEQSSENLVDDTAIPVCKCSKTKYLQLIRQHSPQWHWVLVACCMLAWGTRVCCQRAVRLVVTVVSPVLYDDRCFGCYGGVASCGPWLLLNLDWGIWEVMSLKDWGTLWGTPCRQLSGATKFWGCTETGGQIWGLSLHRVREGGKGDSGWMLLALIGRCGAWLKQGPGHGRTVGPGVVHTLFVIGSIHRLVVGSLYQRKMTFPLNKMSHLWLSKTTVHPALHKGQIPMRDAIAKDGTMCPVSIVGSPGMLMSQMCVDDTLFP